MERNKILKVKGKDYTLSFPSVGQMMNIETFKISYTNGKYVDMALSTLSNHGFALDCADALAYLSTLIPDLQSDLSIKNWRDIDAFLAKDLIKIYKNDFIPWYKPLLDELYNYNQQDDGEKTEPEE